MERGLRGIVLTSIACCLSSDVGPFVMTRENLGTRNYKCPRTDNVNDPTVKNNFHFRGAALGGWLVLEPWITPSLFYQFLGANERYGDEAPSKVGMDSSSFCTALGDEEANKQLRRHWKTWYVVLEHTTFASLLRTYHYRIPSSNIPLSHPPSSDYYTANSFPLSLG